MIGQNCVKICSLRSVEHADWVVDAGADMFGLIFAEARRQVSEDTARQIVERARAAGTRSGPKSVGVFVDHPVDEMNRIADEVGLDFVQINRPSVLDSAFRVERPVLLVIHTAPGLRGHDESPPYWDHPDANECRHDRHRRGGFA